MDNGVTEVVCSSSTTILDIFSQFILPIITIYLAYANWELMKKSKTDEKEEKKFDKIISDFYYVKLPLIGLDEENIHNDSSELKKFVHVLHLCDEEKYNSTHLLIGELDELIKRRSTEEMFSRKQIHAKKKEIIDQLSIK